MHFLQSCWSAMQSLKETHWFLSVSLSEDLIKQWVVVVRRDNSHLDKQEWYLSPCVQGNPVVDYQQH